MNVEIRQNAALVRASGVLISDGQSALDLMALAIVGDFSRYQSENLKDFIFESNQGKAVRFAATEDEAVAALAKM